MMKKKKDGLPNILFAIADDASHFGCYGHSFVKTPNIDSIAERGVRFDHMYTTNPKCAPSRASILSGKHTWQLKDACTHFCVFPGKDEVTVFPDLLEDAGYHVGYTNKGWAPGDYTRNGRTRNPAGNPYNESILKKPTKTSVTDNDYTANFKTFLDDREDGQPFYFWYGAKEPHRWYSPGQGARAGKQITDIDVVPPYWPDEEVVRNDMLDYAYEIEWFDKHLGQMLDHLEFIGELENTLVIATSDNGMPFPRVKGQMYDDDFRLPCVAMWLGAVNTPRIAPELCSFIDFMPTFLEMAGITPSKELPGTSLMDVLNGTTAPGARTESYMGRERHDLGREDDKGYPVRCIRKSDYLLAINYEPDRWPAGNPETNYPNCDASPTKSRVLELKDAGDETYYQYAFGKRPRYELFHIPTDPFCITNLADDPAYAPILSELETQLTAYLKETGDPRAFGNGDIFDTYEYLRHDQVKHSWKAYIEGWGIPKE